MIRGAGVLAASAFLAAACAAIGQAAEDASAWTIYITNDNCPDYTWGLTEGQTRQAFADVVKGHLDEMKRTDGQPPENQDRYNMAVTQEALCFVERYPGRKDELVRRIQEGRVYVSPYLCNSLWAFQSAEGMIRTFYPAARLQRTWGIPFDCAHHIELPSLPWGVPTILAGCGIGQLSAPYLGYDTTFGGLDSPPLFFHEGPDGSRVKVVMDRWACSKSHYTQGAKILRQPETIEKEWIPHYAGLGSAYPLRAILASGTHGDISPRSGDQARGFAEAIIKYNARPERHARLVNATFPQFWRAVEEAQSKSPFLPMIRGSFGHSWDLWPVCLAKYVADMREGERTLLAAESLLAVAGHGCPNLNEQTRTQRERAEWCWAMLSDHAWNGTGEENKRHNAGLRRKWSRELNNLAESLLERGWSAAGLQPDAKHVAVFNSLSIPRSDLVRVEGPKDAVGVVGRGRVVPCQAVPEDGRTVLYFLSPEMAGFGLQQFRLTPGVKPLPAAGALRAAQDLLESPYYRLILDLESGGINSLVYKPAGTELVADDKRGLCQTVFFDGQEHKLSGVKSEVVAEGPVLARLRITGTAAGIEVINFVTVYAELDRVDFDLRITKPTSTKEERLCQVFPVLGDGAVLRISTAGAVVRPRRQPEGDLLPGADTRRFAVQEFVNASSEGLSVTLVPLDAFALRLDLDPISIEALGNDQNYREVLRDQNGVTQFRFRYGLGARDGGYKNAETVAFSRSVATPLLASMGCIATEQADLPVIRVDPNRAIATCLKPADGDPSGGSILRLWEVAGRSGPLAVGLKGCGKVVRTDLLERDLKELEIVDGQVVVQLRAQGYCALRLLP